MSEFVAGETSAGNFSAPSIYAEDAEWYHAFTVPERSEIQALNLTVDDLRSITGVRLTLRDNNGIMLSSAASTSPTLSGNTLTLSLESPVVVEKGSTIHLGVIPRGDYIGLLTSPPEGEVKRVNGSTFDAPAGSLSGGSAVAGKRRIGIWASGKTVPPGVGLPPPGTEVHENSIAAGIGVAAGAYVELEELPSILQWQSPATEIDASNVGDDLATLIEFKPQTAKTVQARWYGTVYREDGGEPQEFELVLTPDQLERFAARFDASSKRFSLAGSLFSGTVDQMIFYDRMPLTSEREGRAKQLAEALNVTVASGSVELREEDLASGSLDLVGNDQPLWAASLIFDGSGDLKSLAVTQIQLAEIGV